MEDYNHQFATTDKAKTSTEQIEINKIINQYFENLFWLILSMENFIINLRMQNSKRFEIFKNDLKKVTEIYPDKICNAIEDYQDKHSMEHIKLLENRIRIKTQDIENQLSDENFQRGYYEFKTVEIVFKESINKNYQTFPFFLRTALPNDTPKYHYSGTLETFYIATLDLINKGKGRINDLFTPKDFNHVGEPPLIRENPTKEKSVNPYPEIFKNYHSYSMFLELRNLTVKSQSVIADYSFIFHKMKHKDIKAINKSVTEPVFIEFLNNTQDTDISVVKLPFRNPKYKEPVYSTVLNKFKGLI